jgi:hypothetical protein
LDQAEVAVKRVQLIALIAAIPALWATPNLAAQDGLYAPVLPDDIAFVRVLNASESTAAEGANTVSLDVGTTRIGPVAAGSGSDYHPVRPGIYVVFASGSRAVVEATTGTFHTVLVTPGAITVIEDEHHDDPLRAQIILYNAAAEPVRLDAVVPSAPLISPVEPLGSGSIAINAIPVTLATVSGTEMRTEFDLELTRGNSFAILVTGADALRSTVIVAGVAAD